VSGSVFLGDDTMKLPGKLVPSLWLFMTLLGRAAL